jgi:hypothetical protein
MGSSLSSGIFAAFAATVKARGTGLSLARARGAWYCVGSTMKYTLASQDAVNALLAAPSVAFGVQECPDIVVLSIHGGDPDWALGLDTVIPGCIVLGYTRLVLDLADAAITTPFHVACIVAAWHALIDAAGTLALSGLSALGLEQLRALVDTGQLNLFPEVAAAVAWLASGYETDVKRSFPRKTTCSECGSEGTVVRRGDHVCDGCGMTFLVTERGETPY